MKVDKDRRRGMIGTITVHVLLLVFILLAALRTPLPLPGEEGVEVNFQTLNNFDCSGSDRFPISSKKRVPLFAISIRPALSEFASVKAPFT